MRAMPRREQRALDRWVEAGLVTAEQRLAIAAHEQAPRSFGSTAAISHRRAVFGEIVGSLGAIAAVVAAVFGVAQLWPSLEWWARVALPLIGGVVLLAASTTVPASGDRSLARLGALLGLLGSAAAVVAAGVLAADTWGWGAPNVALVGGGTAFVLGVAMVRIRPEPHQVLVAVAGLLALGLGAVGQYDHARPEQFGVVVLACAVAVAASGWGGLLPSPATTAVLSAIGAVVGTQMLGSWSTPWSVGVSAAISAGYLGLYIVDRHRTLLLGGLALAVSGIVRTVVSLTADRRPGKVGGAGAVAAMFVVGLLLLAAAVWVIRRVPPADAVRPEEEVDDA